MPRFVIGSVYLLKNKPKMHYLGDMSGVLHFKHLSTGAVYQALSTEVEFEVPKVTVGADAKTKAEPSQHIERDNTTTSEDNKGSALVSRQYFKSTNTTTTTTTATATSTSTTVAKVK